VFKHFMPGLQYAIGATLVVAGFFVVNMATLSDVNEKSSANQRDLLDEDEEEEFDDFDAEESHRRMARALSISTEPIHNNRRASNASALSAHP
jgi:solute carrier family 35 protein F5